MKNLLMAGLVTVLTMFFAADVTAQRGDRRRGADKPNKPVVVVKECCKKKTVKGKKPCCKPEAKKRVRKHMKRKHPRVKRYDHGKPAVKPCKRCKKKSALPEKKKGRRRS